MNITVFTEQERLNNDCEISVEKTSLFNNAATVCFYSSNGGELMGHLELTRQETLDLINELSSAIGE